jgi:hypothetical protein
MQAESIQQSAAVQRGLQDEQIAKNPEFLEKFTDLDPDSDLYDWLSDELGPSTGKHFALGNREEGHALAAELLARNKAEQMIAERTPKRICREHPTLLALAQGCTWPEGQGPESDNPPAEYRAPISDRRRRVLREAWKLIGSFRSLSEGAEGAGIVGTVQTESRTVQQDETAETGVASRVNGRLFG